MNCRNVISLAYAELSVESCDVNSDQVPAGDSVGFHCTRLNKSWALRFGRYRKLSTSSCTSPSTRFKARMVKILMPRKRNRPHHFRCCPTAVDLTFFIFCQNSHERSFELLASLRHKPQPLFLMQIRLIIVCDCLFAAFFC